MITLWEKKISKIENQQQKKNNKAKSWFLEMIYKIDRGVHIKVRSRAEEEDMELSFLHQHIKIASTCGTILIEN